MSIADEPFFDVVVIGAGPAGGAAAARACQLGRSVALVDKARFPRNKLCGGLFTGRALSRFVQVFGAPPAPALLDTTQRLEFWHSGRPIARVSDGPPVHLTMRLALDADIMERALKAGAFDCTGTGVKHFDTASSRITLNDGRTLRYGILIGADGVNSPTARHLFGKAFDRSRIGFGLETEAPPTPDNTIRIDFDALAWGYGWSFPKTGSTTVGVGGLSAHTPDMKTAMSGYLERLGLPDETPIKGQFIPFGDFRKIPGRGAVLLCGDAAGLVDPITGEGIAHALHSGQLAAEAAHDALSRKAPAQALRLYRQSLRPLHRSLRLARFLRGMLFHPAFSALYRRDPDKPSSLGRHYMRILSGEAEYPDLAIAFAARLPGLVLRRGAKNAASGPGSSG